MKRRKWASQAREMVRRRDVMAQKRAGSLYLAWLIHFGEVEPGQESCGVCLDFRHGVCRGEGRKGEECLRCMEGHAQNYKMIA